MIMGGAELFWCLIHLIKKARQRHVETLMHQKY